MRRHLPALYALLLCLCLPASTWAGGFTYPDQGAAALSRGGAFTARADDPSAIVYNPGALARLKGTHILLSGNVIWESVSFQRLIYDAKNDSFSDKYPNKPTLRMPEMQNSAPGFLSPIVGLSTDLGLDVLDRINLKLLAGVYGPHTNNTREFPRYCVEGKSPCQASDADNGITSPTRYDTNYINMLVVFPSIGLAWEPLPGLRIGGVFQATYSKVKFETVVTGTQLKLATPEDTLLDLDLVIETEDVFTPTGIIGAHWSPLSFLELGASVRIGFPLDSEGTVSVDSKMGVHTQVTPNPAAITIHWRMPWVVRTGVRYIARDEQDRERFDLELDFVWESTGEMDEFVIGTDAEYAGQPFDKLNQEHAWKDTWSLRLGGSYQIWDLIPNGVLRFNLGGFYESEAMPEEYTRLDFPALSRWGLGGGVTAGWRWIDLTVGYMHVWHDDRSVKGSKTAQMAPLNPEAATTITDGNLSVSMDMLLVSLGFAFGGGEAPGQPTCTFCP